MSGSPRGPLMTLEPLIECVREGVESAGWELSGLQKTTSHEFEGRWAGESTRSAYLFFHRSEGDEGVSVDVFLDETSRGLRGNLALAVTGRRLAALGGVPDLLRELGEASEEHVIEGYETPLTLRVRSNGRRRSVDEMDTECRFKLRIPATAIEAGPSAVTALSTATVRSFEALLDAGALVRFMPNEDG